MPRLAPFASSFTSRRGFLAAGFSLAAASVWSSRALGVLKQNVKLADHPFQLGVASGDPSPDGFVIWTRLAPKPLEGGGMPARRHRSRLASRRRRGDDESRSAGHDGRQSGVGPFGARRSQGLKPDRWYWYQFKAGGDTSPIGRARTFPPAEQCRTQLRFAFASCQHYESGLFTAYEHMVEGRPGPRRSPGRLHLRGRRPRQAGPQARRRRS